ncbi:MAG: phosphotransferase [Eubacterium sp.]|nr:phosphotransferase [Eubacterium sp.]
MEILNKDTIKPYLIEKHIFPADASLTVIDLHEAAENIEGYVNLIFKVTDDASGHSVVVKHILPYMRAALEWGEVRPMLMERLRTEITVLTFMGTLYPGITPEIFLFDETAGVIVMEDLSHLELLRFEMTAGKTFPGVGKTIGAFLAKLFFYTSDLLMSDKKYIDVKHFFYNEESKRLQDLLFTDNMLTNPDKALEPSARETQKRILANPLIKKTLADMEQVYLNKNECLIHNDLHSANVMVGGGKIKIIDTEFSGYGPKAVDMGRFTGSLIINYLSWNWYTEAPKEKRMAMQAHCLELIAEVFESYAKTLRALWQEHRDHSYLLMLIDCESVLKDTFHDTLRYAAISTITRVSSDAAQTCDIRRIKGSEALGALQSRAMDMAEYLLVCTETITSLDEFLEFLRCCAGIERQ